MKRAIIIAALAITAAIAGFAESYCHYVLICTPTGGCQYVWVCD
jgi:hypothetical protein